MIDEYKGFLFLDKKDMPEVALHWEKHFEWALAKHNRIYKEQLPKITPHVCRHTYCSNMAKSGMNPKTLQYIMGHSDIGVTLNTYTHIGFEDAQEELQATSKMAQSLTATTEGTFISSTNQPEESLANITKILTEGLLNLIRLPTAIIQEL